ncbi:GNAT family N-acetyltransferase [Aquibium carbonis]|uniref:GNAT family N-acetyltransferase n=1 Tax=Aquibium carbonis TaxID=2495581 RepID=A0A429Z0D2_9HYPH|nr:GNAT family N-acetyltransferase [Aquibium carbonis]RST87186.1 GNAT family N-acetyltransferase [Aquibium carbonis]
MKQDLDIRPIGEAKMPGLASLYRYLHPQDPALAVVTARMTLRQTAAEPGSAVLVGFLDDRPIATCALIVVRGGARSAKPSALIENIVTHPTQRRLGYGTRVLAAVLALAREVGCDRATVLTTSLDVDVPSGFFLAAGFAKTASGFRVFLD